MYNQCNDVFNRNQSVIPLGLEYHFISYLRISINFPDFNLINILHEFYCVTLTLNFKLALSRLDRIKRKVRIIVEKEAFTTVTTRSRVKFYDLK